MKKLKLFLLVFVSLGLFIGGIILLALRYPFWSLILGLPSIQIGIILLILTFDRLSQEEVENEIAQVHQVPCALCGEPTFTRGPEVKGICSGCDKKLLGKMEKIKPS